MKIEKLNDNQIRCTLTRADLADRQIKLSELVCGGEKAKSLFHDMMQRASAEFGFEVEDMPLMIEAIPAAADSIVLIITKVDDPEELDSKFSRFGAAAHDFESKKHAMLDKLEGAEEILDLINKMKGVVSDAAKPAHKDPEKDKKVPRIRLFSFASIDCVIHASHLLKNIYNGANTLYKDAPNSMYVLALSQSEHTIAEFNKICNMLSEYGSAEKVSSAVLAYLEEHCEIIVSESAVQQLSCI
ncbi:MAG: adaptor protein MecA [Tyzzerella sp.]|nr:adaptor protein MecA [Tyzzerella sp.]